MPRIGAPRPNLTPRAERGSIAGVARRYETGKAARFVVERVGGAEQIRIPAVRSLFVLAFLGVWLCGWTIGGATALATLRQGFNLFLVVWMVGWALGWVVVVATIGWQLAGAEILRAEGGDLEIGWRIGPLGRRRLYRGVEIRELEAVPSLPASRWAEAQGPAFFGASRGGSLRFTYGARTIHAAVGLDAPEARMILEHLRMRLPMSAVAAGEGTA